MSSTVGIKRLFAAIILQALRDLKSKDKAIKNDAQWFFLSESLDFYLQYLDIKKSTIKKSMKIFMEAA